MAGLLSPRCLIFAGLAALASASLAGAAPPAPPHTLVKKALKQIRSEWSHLLPASTWGGWTGDDAGLTEGHHAGWGGNAATQVPFVRFDDVDVMTVPSWQGTPQAAANPGGLTNGLPPYRPNGRVGVWLNAAALDSDLLFIKTALFHELVHVSQWRDTGSTWTPTPGGGFVYSGPREKLLFSLKEVEASARSLKFLQALLKKGEFTKKRIQGMIRDQMANLQRHLRTAAANAEKLGQDAAGRALLGRMLPKNLVALILSKKFATFGWAEDGFFTNDELAHLLDVTGMLDAIDGARDGQVTEQPPPDALRTALLQARADRELGHPPFVRAAVAWARGGHDQALRALDQSRSKILRAADSEDPELTRGALLFVDALESSMNGEPLPAAQAVMVSPPPGSPAVGTVALVVEDASGAGTVLDAAFFASSDFGTTWTALGADRTSLDGWSLDWDSRTAPDGTVLLSAALWGADGRSSEAWTEVLVDNLEPLVDPEVLLLSPPEGEAVAGLVLLDALALPGALGPANPTGATFEACADSPDACWTIGEDDDPTDGLSLEWNSAEVTDGPLILRALVHDASGGEGLSLVGVFVDNEGGLLP